MSTLKRIALLGLMVSMFVSTQLSGHCQPSAKELVDGEWAGGSDATGDWMFLQVRFATSEKGLVGTLDGFFEAPLGFDARAAETLTLKSVSVDSQAVRFVIPSPSGRLSFDGTLKDGVIRGTIVGGKKTATLHLIRTSPINLQADSRLVGHYKVGSSRVAVTWREFGGLRLINLDSGASETLIPVSGDTFYTRKSILTSADSPEKISFVADRAGKVIGFERARAGAAKSLGVRVHTYRQEQVSFRNGAVSLSGTLLLPPGKGPHPAVVLVHGYGPIYRSALFERAAQFARMGVAALIYDKRGTGQSGGDWRMSATSFEDLAGDALAAIRLLKSRKDVEPGKIGLHGHSQAGNVIPIAAGSKDVAFIIVASGGGVRMEEGVLYEKRNDLIAAGRFSAEQVEAATGLLRRVHDFVIRGIGDRDKLEAEYLESQKQPWFRLTDLPAFRSLPSPEAQEMYFARREISFDPAPYVEKIKVPVLLLFGDEDRTIPFERAAMRWRESLKKAGNRDVEVEIIPGANHGLRTQIRGAGRVMAPEYWPAVSQWLFIRLDGVKKASL